MATLDDVKLLLGVDDDTQDNKLNLIITMSERGLLSRLNGRVAIPEELSHIVTEVSVRRFNKIGSEGMASESIEGHSATYNDSLFAPYEDEISRFLSEPTGEPKQAKMWFL